MPNSFPLSKDQLVLSFSWTQACPEGIGLIGPMQGAISTQSHNPFRLATPPGSMTPTLFEQLCGFFYVPQEQISESAVRRGSTNGFSSLSKKTRKSNHLQMSLQRQHFLLSYLKTLSVGSARVLTPDLPLSRPALSQLS